MTLSHAHPNPAPLLSGGIFGGFSAYFWGKKGFVIWHHFDSIFDYLYSCVSRSYSVWLYIYEFIYFIRPVFEIKMSSAENERIHLIQLGYSSLIVICKFSHFALICLDIWYDTFLLASILSIKLLNVTSSLPITSPRHHAPHITRRSHITSNIIDIIEFT
jgi:hypothetical protein